VSEAELRQNSGKSPPHAGLSFEAPYLLRKLCRTPVARDLDEAGFLFREVKRYLLLQDVDGRTWPMYSRRIDEAWHQFILYTKAYHDFCDRFLGGYLHHTPLPPEEAARQPDPRQPKDFHGFALAYRRRYGESLPTVWLDHVGIAPSTRVLNEEAGSWSLLVAPEGPADFQLLGPEQELIISVNSVAFEALRFASGTEGFYVRELPGLTDDEGVAMVSTLVRLGRLKLGL